MRPLKIASRAVKGARVDTDWRERENGGFAAKCGEAMGWVGLGDMAWQPFCCSSLPTPFPWTEGGGASPFRVPPATDDCALLAIASVYI